MGSYTCREANSLVLLCGKDSTSHTLLHPTERMGLGRVSPPHQRSGSEHITAPHPLRNTTDWTPTPANEVPKQPSCMFTKAEEVAGTSQEKWDFMVIAPTCLQPSEVPAGGFKKHSTFPLSRRPKPQGKDIPC